VVQVAGDGVEARPQPAKERKRVALGHLVFHVVTEDRPLVVELVVDANYGVPHIDWVGRIGNVLAVRGVRMRNDARGQIQHGVGIEQLVRNLVSGEVLPWNQAQRGQLRVVVWITNGRNHKTLGHDVGSRAGERGSRVDKIGSGGRTI